MLSSFARQSIIRLRYPTTTDQGVTVPDYTADPDPLDVAGCWLEPTQSLEDADGRLAVQTGYVVAAPYGADIISTDHVEYGGIEFEVIGDPMQVLSPTGALDSSKLFLRRWEG